MQKEANMKKEEKLKQSHSFRYWPSVIRSFFSSFITYTNIAFLIVGLMLIMSWQPYMMVILGMVAGACVLAGIGLGIYFAAADYSFYKNKENDQLKAINQYEEKNLKYDNAYDKLINDESFADFCRIAKQQGEELLSEPCFENYTSKYFSMKDYRELIVYLKKNDDYKDAVGQWLEQRVQNENADNNDKEKLSLWQQSRPVSAFQSTMTTIVDVVKIGASILALVIGLAIAPPIAAAGELILLGAAGTSAVSGAVVESNVRRMMRERDGYIKCLKKNAKHKNRRNRMAKALNNEYSHMKQLHALAMVAKSQQSHQDEVIQSKQTQLTDDEKINRYGLFYKRDRLAPNNHSTVSPNFNIMAHGGRAIAVNG